MYPFFASILFLVTSGILFFVPGWLMVSLFFKKNTSLAPWETLLFSFGISVGLLDFLMIFLGKVGIPLHALSLSYGLIISMSIIVVVAFLWKRSATKNTTQDIPVDTSFTLTKLQGILFIVLIALTILIKTVYMTHAILPTATDLGHHMYWAKLIAVTGELPVYAKQNIITGDDGAYHITAPEPIADFIIGEHLPFAALNLFTGIDFLSAFPMVFLLLVNILSLIVLYILTLRLVSDIHIAWLPQRIYTPNNVALVALFFFGPLYTLASPQTKFVSGGVVGNTFGNFFIPFILLLYYRAFKEKHSGFLALGFLATFTLAYIHHLSTLILLFILIASVVIYLLFHFNRWRETLFSWWKLFFSPAPLFIALLAFLFFFAIAMPTYIETNAVSTALGTPTKATRTGLSFLQMAASSGEVRVALGFVGFVFLLLLTRIRYAEALLLGWCGILLVMTLSPKWLLINIPSNRIGAYLSFPLGILAALAMMLLYDMLFTTTSKIRLPVFLFLLVSFATFTFAIGSGSLDNNQTLLPKNKAFEVLQTLTASRYLAEHSQPKTIILKDHNYIVADAWMKLFFLSDYAYPLSRGYFKRYEDNPHREQCTLYMISVPNTLDGEKCYNDLKVQFVVVHPYFDTAQFEKSQKFSRVYASDTITIYSRK
ncbi:MAG TPA: hypothetical protein VJH89_03690 [Patescibacteria group bacterium]|nr:hypothetical protein [Patescibacteria group bacterium]